MTNKIGLAVFLTVAHAFTVQGAFAGNLPVKPLVKNGYCPSAYTTSGNYCQPGSGARYALPKHGNCPSGYKTSGNYCLAGNTARYAISKVGGCPSGYTTNGRYCLSSR